MIRLRQFVFSFGFQAAVVAATFATTLASPAFAHISYSNRNFGTWSGSSVTGYNGTLAGGAVTIAGQTVSSSFGWADATDVNWGDSHRMRAYRFSLSSPATVTITAQRQNLVSGTAAAGQQTGADDVLLPGFSLYAGLSHTSSPLAHDSSSLSVEWLRQQFGTTGVAEDYTDGNSNGRWDPGENFTDTNANGVWDSANLGNSGKEGSFNALGNWSIGNSTVNWPTVPADPRTDSLRSFTYVGHAVDGTTFNYGAFGTATILGDGLANGFVTGTFYDLPAGDYSIFVGGASYGAQAAETMTFGAAGTSYPTYGVSLTVSAVPEPTGVALAATGLGAVAWLAARRRRGG
jgi:hypothetical protein